MLSDEVIILSGRPVIPIIDSLLEPKHIKNAGGPDYMFARGARSGGGGEQTGVVERRVRLPRLQSASLKDTGRQQDNTYAFTEVK